MEKERLVCYNNIMVPYRGSEYVNKEVKRQKFQRKAQKGGYGEN